MADTKTHPPIIHLIVALQNSGQEVVSASGFMNAMWQKNMLDDSYASMELHTARKAAQKALDAIDTYEASLRPAQSDVVQIATSDRDAVSVPQLYGAA
ncbi:MAG: hypothetical protein J0G33_02845 [Afipia felis]|nr:hypothetical protein [Afipia felis]